MDSDKPLDECCTTSPAINGINILQARQGNFTEEPAEVHDKINIDMIDSKKSPLGSGRQSPENNSVEENVSHTVNLSSMSNQRSYPYLSQMQPRVFQAESDKYRKMKAKKDRMANKGNSKVSTYQTPTNGAAAEYNIDDIVAGLGEDVGTGKTGKKSKGKQNGNAASTANGKEAKAGKSKNKKNKQTGKPSNGLTNGGASTNGNNSDEEEDEDAKNANHPSADADVIVQNGNKSNNKKGGSKTSNGPSASQSNTPANKAVNENNKKKTRSPTPPSKATSPVPIPSDNKNNSKKSQAPTPKSEDVSYENGQVLVNGSGGLQRNSSRSNEHLRDRSSSPSESLNSSGMFTMVTNKKNKRAKNKQQMQDDQHSNGHSNSRSDRLGGGYNLRSRGTNDTQVQTRGPNGMGIGQASNGYANGNASHINHNSSGSRGQGTNGTFQGQGSSSTTPPYNQQGRGGSSRNSQPKDVNLVAADFPPLAAEETAMSVAPTWAAKSKPTSPGASSGGTTNNSTMPASSAEGSAPATPSSGLSSASGGEGFSKPTSDSQAVIQQQQQDKNEFSPHNEAPTQGDSVPEQQQPPVHCQPVHPQYMPAPHHMQAPPMMQPVVMQQPPNLHPQQQYQEPPHLLTQPPVLMMVPTGQPPVLPGQIQPPDLTKEAHQLQQHLVNPQNIPDVAVHMGGNRGQFPVLVSSGENTPGPVMSEQSTPPSRGQGSSRNLSSRNSNASYPVEVDNPVQAPVEMLDSRGNDPSEREALVGDVSFGFNVNEALAAGNMPRMPQVDPAMEQTLAQDDAAIVSYQNPSQGSSGQDPQQAPEEISQNHQDLISLVSSRWRSVEQGIKRGQVFLCECLPASRRNYANALQS